MPESRASRFTLSWRVGVPHYETDAAFADLMAQVHAHIDWLDEIAFFDSVTHHLYLPLDVFAERAAILKRRIVSMREAGVRSVGINVLATLGHLDEAHDTMPPLPFQPMVGMDGALSSGCGCPNSPELRDYIGAKYALMAGAGPDFIWVDDDVRLLGHKPITYSCFCNTCISRFCDDTDREYTRESLLQAFDSGTLEQRLDIRRKWIEHNRITIDELFKTIEDAVHQVNPALPIGFMTGDRFYEGYAFARWAKTLAGSRGVEVRWRPGGGFYSDEKLMDMVDKAHAIGRQVSALPPDVKTIQSELENFPYQRLRKSAHTTVLEAAAHMAAGTTGTAFNILTMTPDPLDEYGPLYAQVAKYRPLYSVIRAELGRSLVRGVWPAWNQDTQIAANADDKWFTSPKVPLGEPYVLGELGIPICYAREGASVTALAGASVLAFSRDELKHIFAGGVLMDVPAWYHLRQMGLATLTGVGGADVIEHDAIEVLTQDPLNGRFGGWSRDCRQSFWWEPAHRLIPLGSTAHPLARLADYGSQNLGPCMFASTNELGGRVVVAGYYPWSQMHSLAKSSQMRSICRWLSKDSLPASVDSFSKVVIWCRDGERGRKAVVLINASLDPAEKLTLRLPGPATSAVQIAEDGTERPVTVIPTAANADGSLLELGEVAPWAIRLVLYKTA